MKPFHAFFAAVLVLSATGAWAQWQWVDKDGRKVFSDRAPGADIPEKSILKRPGGTLSKHAAPSNVGLDAAPTPTLAASKAGGDKTLETKKKQAEEAEASKRKTEEERLTKAKVENCTRAKQAKASMEGGGRIARTNAAGEREILDDAAKTAESQRIQGIIDAECK
nr:DUF4124 domain-containing protein [uncultured Rhodoferax sp.]